MSSDAAGPEDRGVTSPVGLQAYGEVAEPGRLVALPRAQRDVLPMSLADHESGQ